MIKSRRSIHSFLLVCFVVVASLFAPRAFAQMETGSVSGRVIDESGRVISQAEIVLVDNERNLRTTIHSNATGVYRFSNIRPGHYRMQVTADGFRVVNLTQLTINAEDALEENFNLAVGSNIESITVQARTTPLDASGAVTTIVDQKLVDEAPLNGRSIQSLIELTPGVVVTPTSNSDQGQFSVNGQRADANYFTLDGAGANTGMTSVNSTGQTFGGSIPAFSALGGTNTLVAEDAIQEFAIQSSTYAPEFGRNPGAQVSIVTKSGTNAYHGTAFEYLRNDLLDANDWFANHAGLPRPELRQNDFGGVLGGPIRKNKTFFFISYEGLRLRQPSTVTADVPSLASRQAAPGSLQPFFNAYPLPTGANEAGGLAVASYNVSNPGTLNAGSVRVDHRINDNLNVFVRYAYAPSNTSSRGVNGAPVNVNSFATINTQSLTAGVTKTFTSNLANDLRFNWTSTYAASGFSEDTFGGAGRLPSELPPGFTLANSVVVWDMSVQARNGELIEGTTQSGRQRQINLVDSASWQLHGHLLKFGVDYRRLMPIIQPSAYQAFAFFSSIAQATNTQIPDFGNGVSRFEPISATYLNYSLYAQDTWTPFRRLNVTYGVRWDYNPAPSAQGQTTGFAPLALQGSYPNFSVAPPGTNIYNATKDNFAPRLGFAYQLNNSARWTSVLRAGFGIFYDTGNTTAGESFKAPPFSSSILFSGQQTWPLPPALQVPPPLTLNSPYLGTVYGFPNTLKTPYVYQWNVALEQSLGPAETLTATYIGSAGHSLLRLENISPSTGIPAIFPSGINLTTNQGYSNYNALQLQFRRRATQNLDVLATYTFAHSLDNVSSDASFLPFGQFLNPATNYGPSDFDIRQTATVGADYAVPGISAGKFLERLTSGWGIDPLLTVRSAPPVDVEFQRNIGFGTTTLRPSVVPAVPLYLYGSTIPGGRQINSAAFAVSASLSQGNLSRNSLRGFTLVQPDLAIRRTFTLTERIRLQARLEAFNIVNHPSFAPPSGFLGSVNSHGVLTLRSTFGVSAATLANGLNTLGSGTGFSPLYQVGGPRSLQAALKLQF